jgi:hypothetical protein
MLTGRWAKMAARAQVTTRARPLHRTGRKAMLGRKGAGPKRPARLEWPYFFLPNFNFFYCFYGKSKQ